MLANMKADNSIFSQTTPYALNKIPDMSYSPIGGSLNRIGQGTRDQIVHPFRYRPGPKQPGHLYKGELLFSYVKKSIVYYLTLRQVNQLIAKKQMKKKLFPTSGEDKKTDVDQKEVEEQIRKEFSVIDGKKYSSSNYIAEKFKFLGIVHTTLTDARNLEVSVSCLMRGPTRNTYTVNYWKDALNPGHCLYLVLKYVDYGDEGLILQYVPVYNTGQSKINEPQFKALGNYDVYLKYIFIGKVVDIHCKPTTQAFVNRVSGLVDHPNISSIYNEYPNTLMVNVQPDFFMQ